MNIKKQLFSGVCLLAFCMVWSSNAYAKRPWVDDEYLCFSNAEIVNISVGDTGEIFFEAAHAVQGEKISKVYKNILSRNTHDVASKVFYVSEGQKMLYLAMTTGQKIRGWCDNKHAKNPEVWELEIGR